MAGKRGARGAGSISFHKARNLWRFTASLGVDSAGKRQRLVIYAATKPALLRKVADERARSGGTFGPRAIGTFGEWMEAWLEDEVRPNRSAATHASYATVWRIHGKPVLGRVALDDLSVDYVSLLMRRLRAAGVSSSMIDRCLRVMHRAIVVATRQGRFMRANPFAMVERPRIVSRDVRSMDVDESQRFIAAAADDRLEAMWLIAVTCGLRLGELQALRWSDVDLAARTIAVRRSYSVAAKDFKPPKTRSSIRTLSYGSIVADALARRKAAHARERHGSDLIFCTTRGTAMQQSNLRRKHFAPILAAAGITNLRIHDLRHSATTLGLLAGVSPKVMSGRLGHSTTRITMDRYAHVIAGQDDAAANAIDEALTRRK